MKLVLNIVGILIVLAICFLISWARMEKGWNRINCRDHYCYYYRKSTTWTKTDQLIIQWIDSSYQLRK